VTQIEKGNKVDNHEFKNKKSNSTYENPIRELREKNERENTSHSVKEAIVETKLYFDKDDKINLHFPKGYWGRKRE